MSDRYRAADVPRCVSAPCSIRARAVLALILCSCATTRPVLPEDVVSLQPNEGLLVVHVRTNATLLSLKIDSVLAAQDVPPGTHVRVIAATAGEYRWSETRVRERSVGWIDFGWYDDPALRFQVEPGVLNYVGMVDIHRFDRWQITMRSVERTAMALDALRETYPELIERYRFVYSGPNESVFLDRYGGAAGAAQSSNGEPAD